MHLWEDLTYTKSDVLLEGGTEIDFSYISYQNREHVTDEIVFDIITERVIGINLNYCFKISDYCVSYILKKCPKLADLFVAGCPKITDSSISSIAESCSTIKCINVSENKNITSLSINKLIESSPQLEQLYAYKCKITSLPENIGFLLTNIQTFYVNDNKITKLPRTITKLIGVCDHFYVKGNPLQDPPETVANQGLKAIQRYFTDNYEREVFPTKKQLFTTLFSSLVNSSNKNSLVGVVEKAVVLEIGIGSFPNAIFYNQTDISQLDIIGIDSDNQVETHARNSAKQADILQKDSLKIIHAVSEDLPIPDASVHAVVCTLTLCSVLDPIRTVSEIKRVLKPGGKFLFWEHVLSETDESLKKRQIALSPQQVKIANGCHLDRSTGETIRAAGFSKLDIEYVELTNFSLLNPTIYGIATK